MMSGNFFRIPAVLAFFATAGGAVAHEFTAAIMVTGENREVRLAEAVNGFLLAADERDGHPNETSDGHLGGVDVQVLPLPEEAAGLVTNLVGSPREPVDVVVLLGPPVASVPDGALVMQQGGLPPEADWSDAGDPDGFAARHLRAYGTLPTRAAAEGYNAALRLDRAIRPLDGVADRSALSDALAASREGIDW